MPPDPPRVPPVDPEDTRRRALPMSCIGHERVEVVYGPVQRHQARTAVDGWFLAHVDEVMAAMPRRRRRRR